MIKLLRLELSNVVYFKEAAVSMVKSKLTFLRGLNLDSDPATPSSNGAGKTLLMSTIPNVFYFSTPISIKKKAKKDIRAKDSTIALTFRSEDGSKYKVTQSPSRYHIEKDGEDLNITRIPLAEAMIRELFPLSEVLFYSTCYVSTQRPFPFQQDSDSSRLEHLVDMFRLDQYDKIRDYFAQKLRGLKDDEVKLSVLEQRIVGLGDKVTALQATLDAIDIKSLKVKSSKYESSIKALEAAQYEHKVELNALKTLHDVEVELDSLRATYNYKTSPDDTLKFLKSVRSEVRTYETYRSKYEQYRKLAGSINKSMKALSLPESTSEECLEQSKALTRDLAAAKTLLKSSEEKYSKYKKIVEEGKVVAEDLLHVGVDVKHGDVVDLNAELESQLSIYRTTLKLEKLLKDHDHEGGVVCPTCLSDIDLDGTRKAVRDAKKAIPRLEQRIHAQSLYRSYLDKKSKLKELDFRKPSHQKLTSAVQDLNDSIAQVTSDLDVWHQHSTYTKTLESLECPVQVEKPDTDLSIQDIDAQLDLCADIKKHLEAKSKLVQTHPTLAKLKKASTIKKVMGDTESELRELETTLSKTRKSLSVVSTKIDTYTNAQRALALHVEDLESTNSLILKLRPAVDSKRLLEVLLKAYGAKGLRTILANEICGLIETNMNHYRGLVFAEPFVFSVRASEQGLSIIVDRGNGKVSDVRSLSGAESNFFRMLFVLSVLPLLPSDRRTNFLILDEPTSHADEVSRDIFKERFLPAIQQIVPHTFIITPHESDFIEGSKEWLVKKQDGVSEVITT